MVFCIVLATAVALNEPSSITYDAGFLERVRETVVANAPGLPGGGDKVPSSSVRKDNNNGFRFDFYPWASASWREYTLKIEAAHVFTETVEGSSVPWRDRPNRVPGILTLSNLYLDGRGLADGLLDFRIGRQNMAENKRSVLGLDRLMRDGTSGDSSETYFADMARGRFHVSEKSYLDAFVLYNCGYNALSVGREVLRHRGLNRLTNDDSDEMDQWGGGLVWNSDVRNGFPYRVYSIFKGDEPYSRGDERMPGKRLLTLGLNLMPQLTDTISLDLDAAEQVGRKTNGKAAGGTMAYVGLVYKDVNSFCGLGKPYGTTGLFYMSGDKSRLDADDTDYGWDPLWARTSSPSEIFNNGLHPALRYWTNMLWYNTLVGIDFSRRHRLEAYSGPVFAAVQDDLGGGDGAFKGLLSRINYYLPFLLADASKGERFEIYSAFCIELFNPGDYFESRKPALYVRWMLNLSF